MSTIDPQSNPLQQQPTEQPPVSEPASALGQGMPPTAQMPTEAQAFASPGGAPSSQDAPFGQVPGAQGVPDLGQVPGGPAPAQAPFVAPGQMPYGAPATPGQPVGQTPYGAPVGTAPAYGASPYSSGGYGMPAPAPHKSKAPLIIGLVVALVLVLVIVVGGVFLVVKLFEQGRSITESIETGDSSSETDSRTTDEGDAPERTPDAGSDSGTTPGETILVGTSIESPDWTVIINEVTVDAEKEILEYDEYYNTPAEAGMDYMMVNMTISYTGSKDSEERFLLDFNYESPSGYQTNYLDLSILIPDDYLLEDWEVKKGEMITSNLVFAVPEDEELGVLWVTLPDKSEPEAVSLK